MRAEVSSYLQTELQDSDTHVSEPGLVFLSGIFFGKEAPRKLPPQEMIFARHILWALPPSRLTNEQLIAGLLEQIQHKLVGIWGNNAFSGIGLAQGESDDSKQRSGEGKWVVQTLERQLNKLRLLPRGPGAAHLPKLHVIGASDQQWFIALSDPKTNGPWENGIPRLKFPKGAPSRSILKLEEAFLTFLTKDELTQKLKTGMTAVDLGAAPGGWTFFLVERGLFVTAVDHATLDPAVQKTGMVEHAVADAFKYTPKRPVDWLVCDVVEQPRRIAKLMIHWLKSGWCQRCIFNLKLPMKRRYAEIQKDLALIRQELAGAPNLTLRCRQLYHDRKEVTVFLEVSRALTQH